MDQDFARADHAPARQPLRASILLVPLLVLGAGVMLAAIPTLDGTATPLSAATTVLVVGLGAAYTAGAVIRTRDRPALGTLRRPHRCTEEPPAIFGRAAALAEDPPWIPTDRLEPSEEAQPYDGPHCLDPRAVDLGRLVRRTVGRSRGLAQAAGVDLSVVVLQGPPVLADPDRLAQGLTEVLCHAIEQTPGGGHVRVTVTTIDGVAHVQVTDPGAGPSAEAREPELATARRLAEDHGGILTADTSGEGRGTTVCLRLPILPPRRDPAEAC